MSLSVLPREIKEVLINYCVGDAPINNVKNEMKVYAAPLLTLSLVSTLFKNLCEKDLSIITRKFQLINKFSQGQTSYEEDANPKKQAKPEKILPSPQLCDALMAGMQKYFKKTVYDCSANISQQKFDAQTALDINDIITLMPQSLDYIYKVRYLKNYLRRGHVPVGERSGMRAQPTIVGNETYTPLALACLNEEVPFEIIKRILLSKNGNNLNETFREYQERRPGVKMPLLAHVSSERYQEIKALFKEVFFEKSGVKFALLGQTDAQSVFGKLPKELVQKIVDLSIQDCPNL